MNKELWIEWIGLWGSGKTRCINDLCASLEEYDCTTNINHTFFVQSRYTKICKLLESLPRTFTLLLRFLFLYIPIYISAKINNNVIVSKELRSFLSCYLARILFVNIENIENIDITLWEGEFHILPILNLNNQAMEKIVDNLLRVNQTREVAFVFLKVDIETAKYRILKDQKEGKNIRFSEAQTDLFLDFLPKFNANQNNLINCLKERGQTVYEGIGTIDDISDFIRGLSQDIFRPKPKPKFENHFVCVGAQRAGTTTFFDMIKNHPDVNMSSDKEIHYFDIDDNYRKGPGWYAECFNEDDKSLISGECTPDYLAYSYVPNRIKETLGEDIKLIFILRNPTERAYSQFNFHIMEGVEFRQDFYEAMNSEVVDKENQIYNTWFDPPYYLSRGLYYNQIKRYLEVFPRDNMHFVLFEDLFGENQKIHFDKILKFLGVEPFTLSDVDRRNKSESKIPNTKRTRYLYQLLLNKRKSWYVRLLKVMLPEKLYLLIRGRLVALTDQPAKLSQEKVMELNRKFFNEDISNLQKLLKKDFSSWLP